LVAFDEACDPKSVLRLIAEIDRLGKERDEARLDALNAYPHRAHLEAAIARAEKAEAELTEAMGELWPLGDDPDAGEVFAGTFPELCKAVQSQRDAALSAAALSAPGATEDEIVSRRFGPEFAKPCNDPAMKECALWECQKANACQRAAPPANLQTNLAGWKLVPVESTTEMISAWYRWKNGHHFADEAEPADKSDFGAYRAMLSAAPPAPAGDGWRPIESAPRDGTPVLIFGLWAGEIHGPNSEPSIFIAAYSGPHGDFTGYDWNVDGGDAYACWAKPSHWMPLPAPPSEGGTK
jgi:hypothetical protein